MTTLREPARFGAVIEGEAETVVIDANQNVAPSSTAELTKHPIGHSSAVADHVVVNGDTLSLSGLLTDTPLTGPPETGRAWAMFRSLRAMLKNRERVAVILEAEVYDPAVLVRVDPIMLQPAQAGIGIELAWECPQFVSTQRVFLPPEQISDSPGGSGDDSEQTTDGGPQPTGTPTEADAAAVTEAVEDNRTQFARVVDAVDAAGTDVSGLVLEGIGLGGGGL